MAMLASDRLSARRALPAAEGDRAPAPERRAGLTPDTVARLQRTIGNAAVARLVRVATARRVLARWPPDEQKVRERAHAIWLRRGGGPGSTADADADYFEAQRQIEIEERAYRLAQDRGGGDPVANYYDAEHAYAAERAPAVAAPPAPPPPVAASVRAPTAQPGVGLADALRNRGAGLVNQQAQRPKEYASATEGIEVENPVSYQVVLRTNKARGVMAWVEDALGEKLAEFTTDMGSNPYTIENRTTPCRSADLAGIDARKRALAMLADSIRAAGETVPTGLDAGGTHADDDERKWHTFSPHKGTAVTADKRGDLTLKVKQAHRVVPKSGTARPGVQITKGVGFSEMLAQAEAPTRTGTFGHAQWLSEYPFYLQHYTNLKLGGTPDEAKVFGMLGSLLHFYLRRLDFHARSSADPKEGVGGKAVRDNDEIALPDMTHPGVKNPWGLLPKTPPAKWLAGLDPQGQDRVKKALREVPNAVTGPNRVNATAWKQAYENIVFQGQMIAGHAVPDFKIAGEAGFAFEIRTPKLDEQGGYL
jgi:Protein of unknown function (DUF2934)